LDIDGAVRRRRADAARFEIRWATALDCRRVASCEFRQKASRFRRAANQNVVVW
jgi:hypothetical protein